MHRSSKYAKKIRGLVIPGQSLRYNDNVRSRVELENLVRSLNPPLLHTFSYIACAEQLLKTKTKHKDTTALKEADIITNKWCARGLSSDIINKIRDGLGIPSSYTLFYEDFEKDLSQWTITGGPGSSATRSNEQPHTGSYSLKLVTTGEFSKAQHDITLSKKTTITLWLYDNMDNDAHFYVIIHGAGNILVGVATGVSPTHYIYEDALGEHVSTVARSPGWHSIKFIVKPSGTDGYIDDIQLFTDRPRVTTGTFDRLLFNAGWSKASISYWDDVLFTC